MHKKSQSLALFLLLSFTGVGFGNSNSQVSWKSYQTEHFKIIFHADVKPQADMARDFLEQAYSIIRADMGVADKGILITVVLTGLPDESNGLSTPLGHRIIIYTRPMQTIASGDIAWMKRVLAHELAHQLTFLAMRKSFWGIYSELYKTFHLPAWFVEGVAQYEAESWDAKRNTFFAHVLFNSALEAYPNLTSYTKSDPVSGRLVYEQGHAFVRFLAQRQGKGFLGPLLKRVLVIPVWSEFMGLLTPITGSFLPFESALRAKTGKGIKALYKEFLDSTRAGMPRKVELPEPFSGGIPGFDAVFQIKALGSSTFVFTGQKDWDQPVISLYFLENGKVEKIDPDFVNPVFDLSPDGNRVLYVRDYMDLYYDPVQKLFLRDLRTGDVHFVSDGAAHPIFLGNDSIAFSRYRNGRQNLTLCALTLPKPSCSEVGNDSLVGYYALSPSSHGLLGNATDLEGKTTVFEYSTALGFTSPIQDSGVSEFPVEAPNGSILALREREGLLQVDAWNRFSGHFVPVTHLPLGTFNLHRMASGKIVSISQTGKLGSWNLMPVEVIPPVLDSNIRLNAMTETDSVLSVDSLASLKGLAESVEDSSAKVKMDTALATHPVYHAPNFLGGPLPDFEKASLSKYEPPATSYHSPLEMRPLIIWPHLGDDYPNGSLGGGVLLEDPLQLHTLFFTLAGIHSGTGYKIEYLNRQLPLEVAMTASNLEFSTLDWNGVPGGWKSVTILRRISEYSLQVNIPVPWDIPLPHSFFLGVMARGLILDYSLAGALTDQKVKRLDSWSLQVKQFRPDFFLAYNYLRPYAYSIVHPLLATDLELGHERIFPDDGRVVYWFARQTVPVQNEATVTLWYYGQWSRQEISVSTMQLPDGNTSDLLFGTNAGYFHNFYTSLDFPLRKGYWFELPLLGPLNYVGGSFFGGIGREVEEDVPGYSPEMQWDRKTLGTKLVFLFHPLRRLPVALSQSAQYDFIADEMKYRIRGEFAGLPSSFDLFPDGRKIRHRRLRQP